MCRHLEIFVTPQGSSADKRTGADAERCAPCFRARERNPLDILTYATSHGFGMMAVVRVASAVKSEMTCSAGNCTLE